MDFTKYLDQTIPIFYGGGNGKKRAIKINDDIYMLKFPPADKKNKTEYINSCLSEYVACHIFQSLGISTQETMLGTVTYKGKEKTVVACKDFTSVGIRLQEFAEVKNGCLDSSNNGYGTDLEEVLQAIDEQNIVSPKKLNEFFWNMFIGDALLGNFNRHNGNWGFLVNGYTNDVQIAPVYDCGSCLYPQLSDERMAEILKDTTEIDARVYIFPNSALKIDDRKINYHDYICNLENKECNDALRRIMANVNIETIKGIIQDTPYISEVRKEFYETMINERYEHILVPALQQLQEMGLCNGQSD